VTTFSPTSMTYMLSIITSLMFKSSTMIVGLGALLATLLYFKQESMLYFPEVGGISKQPKDNPRRCRSPSEHDVYYEDVYIQCQDGVKIHAWLMLRTSERNPLPTLVYYHGNAGNIGLRLPNAVIMMQTLNVNILLVEYRGYGNSDNVSINEAGIKLDGQAALDYILTHPKVDPNKLILFGRSLGGAVAFDVGHYAQTKNIPLAGIIVENTFTNIPDMVDHLMPTIGYFKRFILRMKWDSKSIVPSLTCPVLYLAGAADTLVPHQHMLTLHSTTKQSKLNMLHVVPNGTHNETWMQGGPDYWKALRTFLVGVVDAIGKTTTTTTASILSSSSPTTTSVEGTNGSSSHIPIMPNKLFGMLKEVVSSTKDAATSSSSKKTS
jgi:pimeloyl-ACP methyl ester carboxylesterase